MSVVAFVALIAASASCQHQYELAIRHGQTHWVAGLLPFSVGGMIVSATLVLWYAARHGYPRPWGAWLVLMTAIAATAAGNPLSGQLETRLGLSRAEATRVRRMALAAVNGHHPPGPGEPSEVD